MRKYTNYLRSSCLLITLFLFALPASSNFRLDSYGFGAGGEASMSSSNYSLEAILGEIAVASQSSTNFSALSGLIFGQQADVPPAPTFENQANWYNRLHITIDPSDNPSDATYAIAITDNDWVTTQWVQDDNTIGSALGTEDYQTYAAWGGATGEDVINLTPDTSYRVRVKARQGNFTESGLGPEVSASTDAVTLTFDIDISATDSETPAPYAVAFGELAVASVNTAPDMIWVDMATNAENGGFVYIYGANSGLTSDTTGYTITSSTANLASAGEGFGIREDSASNLSFQSPYNVTDDNVGVVDGTIREILNSSLAPVTSGRASIAVKAKPSNTAPAASDYTETITVVAAGNF